jgi:NADPH:quinone reductase-like Zn-dependent oxidoreductase
MKAAVRTSYGPPEVVRIAEVARPTAKDNQVLVKVRATTVNRTDCGFRAGKPFFVRLLTGLPKPRVRILGTEFAGTVEAVGRGVTSFAVGDRVFGFKGLPFGAHAEYMVIPEDGFLATMPAQLGFEEAAPSTEGSHYALALIRRAKIHSGQDALVHGATGAIGSAARPAAQAARRHGDRDLWPRAPGAGQGLGRRPGDRLHGPGLHQGHPAL